MDNRFKNMDTYLESIFSTDYENYKKYKSFSEEEKDVISKNMAANLFRSAKSNYDKLNYKDIEQSKGDITKFVGYNSLNESITFLESMYANFQNAPLDIPKLRSIMNILTKYSNQFKSAFNNRDTIQKMFYSNLIYSLQHH